MAVHDAVYVDVCVEPSVDSVASGRRGNLGTVLESTRVGRGAARPSTPELEVCLARHSSCCSQCQNVQWNQQHRQFKDLLAQLAALREEAADVERQLH
eukprot:1323589-Rhodomonas_salina.1